MKTRKEMKAKAKKVVAKHYITLLIVCLFAAFLGSEFAASLSLTKIQDKLSEDEMQLVEQINNNKPIEEVEKETKQKEEEMKQNEGKILGRSKGVLSLVVNSINSSSIYVSIIQAINSVVKSTNIAIIILIILSLVVKFLIWYFVVNTFKVISRRIFLEGRIYDEIPKQRFLYLYRIKKWRKASYTMFLKFIYQILWSFTIVGGIIKYYSYFLVPYIVAENSDIKATDAIKLSRKMMDGHKWECFVLDLSFIWWEILGFFTLNISKVLYSNPYQLATFCEYYNELRTLAKNNNIENVELLNDTYLYEKADETLLKDTYKDIVEIIEKEEPIKKQKGIKGILENIFGIKMSSEEENKKYEEFEKKQLITDVYKAAVSGSIYPTRLSLIPEKEKRKHIENVNYLRRYSISSLILLFFIFAFVGWIWEVILHLITMGEFINRGVLHGPWLPIYGAGGVIILVLLYRFRKNPALQLFVTTLVCGVIEYFSAYFLELSHNGQKWWDYTGYFLNLHGRICAEGLLIFGLGGLAVVYILAPLIDDKLKKVKPKVLVVCCTILVSLFAIDQIYSSKHPNVGKGITDYAVTMNVQK